MKPTLQLKLSTHLTLTPQLQQSIRLLQLSTLELSQELDQIVSDNPLLERLDDPLDNATRIASDGDFQSAQLGPAPDPLAREASDFDFSEQSTSTTETRSSAEEAPTTDSYELGGADSEDGNNESTDWGADSMSSANKDNSADDEREQNQLGGHSPSLREHLFEQLQATRCSDIDRGLVTLLIENLNSDGYLEATLEELQTLLPPELELEIDDLMTALSLLQSFDPIGVGARHLTECLLIQIKHLPPYEWPGDVVQLSKIVIKQLLPLLGNRDFVKLKLQLGCDDDTLRLVQALIRSLNPKPGSSFGDSDQTYVIPDVVVKKSRNDWKVQLNPDVIPKIRVNEGYAR